MTALEEFAALTQRLLSGTPSDSFRLVELLIVFNAAVEASAISAAEAVAAHVTDAHPPA